MELIHTKVSSVELRGTMRTILSKNVPHSESLETKQETAPNKKNELLITMSDTHTGGLEANNNTNHQTIQVDVISDVACPWCYVGKKRLESAIAQLKQTHPQANVRVHWSPFLLNANTPSEGVDRKQYFLTRFGIEDIEQSPMMGRLTQVGSQLGIQFNLAKPSVISSTINAHRLLMKAAADEENSSQEELESQNRLKNELFRSYFELGQDVGDINVLKDVVKRAGLENKISDQFIEQGNDQGDEYRQRVLVMDRAARLQQGVTGVPFFIFNKKFTVSGGQESSVFLNILKKLL